IAEVERLMPQAQETATWLQASMRQRGLEFRGRGLLLGIELDDALEASRSLLQRGFIALPAGEHGEVLALTPPLCTTQAQLQAFLDALEDILAPTGTP
ncbi:MAG: aminotransferase class III-fold pyridoxal phosphate-dependent enzyme, partial [Myxococcota bacterium]|nr:aminotransferase class III-fold pyridoxal phosphate-dependent enzyme [Myxococcota bacterium]